MNQRIMQAAWNAVFGKLNGLPTTPGLCLAAVRVIIESAAGWPSHELYKRYLVVGTSRRPGDSNERLQAAKADPWAADMEASAKALGWPVPMLERKPGDLVFNHSAAPPYGHVGVLIARDVVLENIDPRYRPESIVVGPSLCLTPINHVPWTLVARIPDSELVPVPVGRRW